MYAHPSNRRQFRAAGVLLAVALVGSACTPEPDGSGGDATVRGRVTDDGGNQYTRVGGTGSIETATTVAAYTVADDGSLHAIGAGSVDADGSFAIDVSSGEEAVIVQALSAEGDVVASAVLESTGEPGDTVTCTPMDTESSVEAEVLLDMIASAGSAEAVNPIDVRLRVDADTAVAVRAAYEDGGESAGDTAIEGLADATLAAQATQLAAWSEMGFETTQQAMFELQMEASQALSEDLYDEHDAEAAWAEFVASISAAVEGEGLSQPEQAECESQAGLAYRLVVDARLDGTLAWEATHSAAQTEAAVEAQAIAALFAAADASSATQDEAEQAGADLVTSVHAAASTAALVTAYGDLQGSLIGETSVEGSTLGTWLEVSGASALLVDASLDSCVESASDLETLVTAEVRLILAGLGGVDTRAVAASVVTAWSDHRAAVEAAIAGAGPGIDPAEAQIAADITVLATASFREVE